MGESILKLKNVNKIFETDAGEVQVLKNINMTIDKGELIGVFGKSGSGKSTLMNMITGIDIQRMKFGLIVNQFTNMVNQNGCLEE